jgi:hypothetical protein
MGGSYIKKTLWLLKLTQKQKQQYERFERLVLNFNVNLKDEVIRSKDKYNNKVRGVIADKTGLTLAFKVNNIEKTDSNDKATIPIQVVDYLPISLIELFDKYDDTHIELLLHYRLMKNTVVELDFQIQKFQSFSQHHQELTSIKELDKSKQHLKKLIEEIENCGILDEIQRLGPDVFGAYFLDENRVELYWLCIGLCNILYDFPIEDFTLVVLIHELVHGYTHIGFDKDGNKWHTDDFNKCDSKIVEGFAEFYTEMICKDYFDKALGAFNALELPIQYTEYKNWFGENEPGKYEKARRILLKTRTHKIINYDEFRHHLEKIKKEF